MYGCLAKFATKCGRDALQDRLFSAASEKPEVPLPGFAPEATIELPLEKTHHIGLHSRNIYGAHVSVYWEAMCKTLFKPVDREHLKFPNSSFRADVSRFGWCRAAMFRTTCG